MKNFYSRLLRAVFLFFLGTLLLVGLRASLKQSTHLHLGIKNDVQQHLLFEVLSQQYLKKTGKKISVQVLDGTFVCLQALLSHDIAGYVEFTGTASVSILGGPPTMDFSEIRKELKKKFNLIALDPFGLTNSYVFVMPRKTAEELQVQTLGDIAQKNLRIAIDCEFYARPEMQSIIHSYGWEERSNIQLLDHSLLHLCIQRNEVDMINGYSSDGIIKAMDLKIISDDQKILPKYEAFFLTTEAFCKNYPEFTELIKELKGVITEDTMQQMTYEVEFEQKSVQEVARSFLKKHFE